MKSKNFVPILWIVLISACANQAPIQSPYLPGLGEFMTQLSYRHGKLWFAGQAQNWDLAAYELDEIKEGLSDISTFHPSHHEVKAIPEQINEHMMTAINLAAQAIQAKKQKAFTEAYNGITNGCNSCHQANGFGFNRIVRPQVNIFTNQQFNLQIR
jgi:cytochrome c553